MPPEHGSSMHSPTVILRSLPAGHPPTPPAQQHDQLRNALLILAVRLLLGAVGAPRHLPLDVRPDARQILRWYGAYRVPLAQGSPASGTEPAECKGAPSGEQSSFLIQHIPARQHPAHLRHLRDLVQRQQRRQVCRRGRLAVGAAVGHGGGHGRRHHGRRTQRHLEVGAVEVVPGPALLILDHKVQEVRSLISRQPDGHRLRARQGAMHGHGTRLVARSRGRCGGSSASWRQLLLQGAEHSGNQAAAQIARRLLASGAEAHGPTAAPSSLPGPTCRPLPLTDWKGDCRARFL